MSIVSLILVFLMMWLIIFFISLPFGLSIPKEQQIGNANSAPDKPNLRLKFFISFFIAFVPTLVINWLIEKNILFDLIINY